MLLSKERMPRHNDKAPKRQVVLFSEKILLNNDTCSNKDSMLSKLYCCLKKPFQKTVIEALLMTVMIRSFYLCLHRLLVSSLYNFSAYVALISPWSIEVWTVEYLMHMIIGNQVNHCQRVFLRSWRHRSYRFAYQVIFKEVLMCCKFPSNIPI